MKPAARILFAVLRTGIGFGLLIYLGISGAINWSALFGMAAAWPVTVAAFLILLVDVWVTSLRLCVLFAPRGLHLSTFASVRLMLIGVFFNACLPGSTGGDLVKIYYATEGNRGRRTEVATIILLDRATGMFALMIWPLLAALFFPRLVASLPVLRALLLGAGAIAAAMLVGWSVATSPRVRENALLARALQRLPLGSYVQRVFDTVYAFRDNGASVLAAVGLSLLAHTLSVGVTLLAARATNPGGVAWEMALLIPLGHLANTLPLTPGGLGVGEAAFNSLFAMAGLTGGAEALLGWRILTILIGLIGLGYYLQGRKKFIHSAGGAALPESQA